MFCTYNFVFNEVPNKNDDTCETITVLNKVPNNNDTICVANHVHLTTMGRQQFWMAAIQPSCIKADLPEMRDNKTKTRNVCADRNKLYPGKEIRYVST